MQLPATARCLARHSAHTHLLAAIMVSGHEMCKQHQGGAATEQTDQSLHMMLYYAKQALPQAALAACSTYIVTKNNWYTVRALQSPCELHLKLPLPKHRCCCRITVSPLSVCTVCSASAQTAAGCCKVQHKLMLLGKMLAAGRCTIATNCQSPCCPVPLEV